MAYNPDQYAGSAGNVTLAGVDLYVFEWSGGEDATLKDATTTGDYVTADKMVYGRDVPVKRRFKFTAKAYIDNNNYQLTAFRAGGVYTNAVLKMTPGHAITITSFILESVAMEPGGIEGVQAYTISGLSQGANYTIT